MAVSGRIGRQRHAPSCCRWGYILFAGLCVFLAGPDYAAAQSAPASAKPAAPAKPVVAAVKLANIIVAGLDSPDAAPESARYASRFLETHVLSPLAGTNTKFIVYYWGLSKKYREVEKVEKILCDALNLDASRCRSRLRFIDLGHGDMDRDAFIKLLKDEMDSLAQGKP